MTNYHIGWRANQNEKKVEIRNNKLKEVLKGIAVVALFLATMAFASGTFPY